MKQPNVLPALLAAAVSLAPTFAVGTTAPPTKGQVTQALFGLAIPFEENKGQVDSSVAFQARTLAGPLFVTKAGELVWSLTSEATAPVCVVERFEGGQLSPAGAIPAVTRVSYLRGNDPAKWQRNVPTWQQVSLGQVWPGISVDVAARGKNAEKIFTLAPGAEVKAITVAVEGGVLQLEANGNLRVSRADKPVVSFSTPVAWQEINGQRQPVEVAYRVADAGKYGFTLGAYDAKHAVMIDPVLQSTYLGGSGTEAVNAIAATTSGIYVAGTTVSANFPGTTLTLGGEGDGYVSTNSGADKDAFVARLGTDLKTITQATYLGGTGDDEALAIAVTVDNVYVAGKTASDSFPGVTNGVDATRTAEDAFVTKLGLNLTLPSPDDIQSTYFGGTGNESAKALAINTSGVFIAGDTASSGGFDTDTDTTGPDTDTDSVSVQGGTFGGGATDAFIAKLPLTLLAADSTGFIATYFGGTGADTANAIALSGTTAVYIAGSTAGSLSFTTGAAQAALATGDTGGDAYVARFGQNLLASNLIKQATYVGGSGADVANAVAVTTVVYVAGTTASTNLPFIATGMDTATDGNDGFVTRLNLDLKANAAIQQSTYVGGAGADAIQAMAINSVAVYVAGETAASNLPFVTGGAQPALVGTKDAFVARLGLNLKSSNTLKQSSYLGGDGTNDSAKAIAIATDNTVYVAGVTNSSNFPSTAGSEDITADATNGDGFVTKFTTDLRAAAPLAETVTFNAATDLASGVATLKGNVTPQGAATTVTFDLGPTTAYGSNPVGTVSGSPVAAMAGKTAVSVAASAADDALTCGITYHYRVVAQNSIGTSRGTDKTFVLPCAPSVTADTPDIDVTSALLKGTVDANGGETLTVWFVFGDNTVTPLNATNTGGYDSIIAANPSTVTGDDAIEVTANKTGLICNRAYFYRVKAVKIGTTTGIYSTEQTFTTTPCSAPIVTTAAASNITKNSAKLLGSVNYGGALTTVEFQFSPTGVYADAVGTTPATYTLLAATPGSVNTAGVKDVNADKLSLDCFTRYHYRIKAKNNIGTSYGNSLFFQTLGCAPKVETQAATAVSVLQANLNAKVTSNGGNAAVTFDIGNSATSFETLNIAAGTAPLMLIVPGTPANGIFNAMVTRTTGLTCGKTYFYRAKASNLFGSTIATPVSFSTPACTPVVATLPPTNITSATLSTVQALLVGTVIPKGLGTLVTFDFGPTTSYGYSVPVTVPDSASGTPSVNIPVGNNAGSVLPFQTIPPISVTGPVSAATDPDLTIDCGGVYNYRVKAINYGGVGTGYTSVGEVMTSPAITGANQALTTKACAPVAIALAADNSTISGAISSNGATLKGTVDANGANTQVFFELGLTPTSGDVAYEPAVAATPASVAGTTATKVKLSKTGLACGRGYTYRVKAVNTIDGVVNTHYSGTQTFTTLHCNPTVTTDAAEPSLGEAVGSTHATNNVTLYGTVTYAGVIHATDTTKVIPYFDLGLTTAYTTTNQAVTVGTFYEVNGVKKTPVTATVSGLTCGNKTYNFRLKAVKPTGAAPTSTAAVTVLGLNRTFTTLPCTEVPSVTTDNATVIENNAATLNGKVKSNGSDTTVTFDFGTTTSYGTSVTATTGGSIGGGTTTETAVAATKSSLVCGTTYNYRVKAVNSAGTTVGANKTFTTVCPPVISTENPTNIKQTTATIHGKVNAKGSNSTVTFDFGTADDLTGSTSLTANPSVVSGTAITPVLFNLPIAQLPLANCGDTFYYRVTAVNNANNQGSDTTNTSHGAIKSFKTVCAPVVATTAPTGQAVYDASTKVTATLNGTVDTGANGAVTNNVSFDFGTNAADCTNKGCYGTKIVASPATVATDAAATAVTATVPNLACGVMYHYRTRAVNAGNVDSAADQIGADKAINAICPAGATTNNATAITTSATAVTATLNGTVTATNKQTVSGSEPATPDTTATFLFDEVSRATPTSGKGDYTTEITTLTAGGTTDGNVNGTVSHNLTASTNPGLTCGKDYYYRLKLVNSDTTTITGVHGGGTTYGAEKSFRTAPCIHTAVTAAPTITSATAATLKGVVNPKGLTDGIDVFFDIGLASNPAGTYTGGGGGTGLAATLPAAGSEGTVDLQASLAKTGLTANTAYRYRVKATHAAATSTGTVYGADVIFTTPAAP